MSDAAVMIADATPSLPRSHLVVVVSLVRDVVDELPLKPPIIDVDTLVTSDGYSEYGI